MALCPGALYDLYNHIIYILLGTLPRCDFTQATSTTRAVYTPWLRQSQVVLNWSVLSFLKSERNKMIFQCIILTLYQFFHLPLLQICALAGILVVLQVLGLFISIKLRQILLLDL